MKTNDEIDDMIKDYINEDSMDNMSVSSVDLPTYSTDVTVTDLVDDDVIDISGLLTLGSTVSIVDNAAGNHTYGNHDVTMEIDGKERSMRELFSTVDAISRRLAVLEPKKHLLDKYEVLQDLYEQYKAAEALLYEDDFEDEELPF